MFQGEDGLNRARDLLYEGFGIEGSEETDAQKTDLGVFLGPHAFLDQAGGLWYTDALVGKAAAAFTSTAAQHGGQETTLFSIITNLLHFGCTVVGLDYGFKAQNGVDVVHCCIGVVCVATSPLARAALTAMEWLDPRGAKYVIVETLDEALRRARSQLVSAGIGADDR